MIFINTENKQKDFPFKMELFSYDFKIKRVIDYGKKTIFQSKIEWHGSTYL